jgi:hypothetical protein
VTSHRVFPVLAERFTIGRVLVESLCAFAGGWRWFLPIALIVAAASILHAELADYTNAIPSPWPPFLSFWVSFTIQSLAIAPIVLRIIRPGEAHLGIMLQSHFWTHTLKMGFAMCIAQIVLYWPAPAMILLPAPIGFPLFWYGLFVINVIAVSTIFSLFYVVFLMEQRSLWHSALHSIRQVKPHIWRMAALVILYQLVEFGGGVAIARLLGLFDASTAYWLDYALQWLLMAFLILAANIVMAVAYRMLRTEREGLEPKHVAVVFD